MAQGDSPGAKWPGARWISGAKKRYHRDSQGRREMQWTGITADKETSVTSNRNELADGAAQRKGMATAGGNHAACQIFFSRWSVYQGLDVVRGQRLCHLAKAFRRPLLGAPPSTRIDDGKTGNAEARDF